MASAALERFDRRAGRIIAWGLFTTVTCCVAYYELINHQAIADPDATGPITHALFFSSLALCSMAVVGGRIPAAFTCLIVTAVAAALELVEVVPTAPGSVVHWIGSAVGIWLAWAVSRRLGEPRSDIGMAVAALLWACGIAVAQLL